jgi:hypothetical protein
MEINQIRYVAWMEMQDVATEGAAICVILEAPLLTLASVILMALKDLQSVVQQMALAVNALVIVLGRNLPTAKVGALCVVRAATAQLHQLHLKMRA